MRRFVPLIMTLGLLTACGADGPPVPPPAPAHAASGISISGSVSAGIARNGG